MIHKGFKLRDSSPVVKTNIILKVNVDTFIWQMRLMRCTLT